MSRSCQLEFVQLPLRSYLLLMFPAERPETLRGSNSTTNTYPTSSYKRCQGCSKVKSPFKPLTKVRQKYDKSACTNTADRTIESEHAVAVTNQSFNIVYSGPLEIWPGPWPTRRTSCKKALESTFVLLMHKDMLYPLVLYARSKDLDPYVTQSAVVSSRCLCHTTPTPKVLNSGRDRQLIATG